MTTAAAPPKLTIDEFLAMDHAGYELVDGHLEELAMGGESSWLATEIARVMGNFATEQMAGNVFSQDTPFAAWSDDPHKLRKPDVMFFRRGRLGSLPRGLIRTAPDLAIEVVSPGDEAEKLALKLQDYALAGIPLVWVIYPEAREAHIYRRGQRPEILGPQSTLDGEDIVPGFRLVLDELFERAAAVQ